MVGVCGGCEGMKLFNFLTHFLNGRWFMVVTSFLIMMANGTGHLFGVYSQEIKLVLGYDQTRMNLLSVFKEIGTSFGVLAGVLMEFTPPWFVILVGCVLNFFGYFMVWLVVTRRISKPSFGLITLYTIIGANAVSFINTSVVVPTVNNFPKSRGVVLGLLKGFLGLGAGIYTQLYLALYGDDGKSALLLISWLPVVVAVVFLRTVRFMKITRPVEDSQVFYHFLYVSLGVAGFLLVMTVLQGKFAFTRVEYILSAAATLLVISSLYIVAFRKDYEMWKNEESSGDSLGRRDHPMTPPPAPPAPPPAPARPALASPSESGTGDTCFQNVFRPPSRGENYTVLQALFSIDMIILLLTSICGLGGTIATISNLGQIGMSLGYPESRVHTFVSLISIWDYLGRVAAGFWSEHLLKTYKVPRPLMLTTALLISCVGHLLIASGAKSGLYVASVIVGFCFGAQLPLIYSIISELFGLKHFSTLFNIGTIATPIGGYFFNVKLTGHLYDKEAKRQLKVSGRVRKPGEELVCNGTKCFRLAFIIIAFVDAFGALLSIVLVFRTKQFYDSDIYMRFRDDNEDDDQIIRQGT